MARNYDMYYDNKETALIYYKKYLTTNDSNTKYINYSSQRILEIQKEIHLND